MMTQMMPMTKTTLRTEGVSQEPSAGETAKDRRGMGIDVVMIFATAAVCLKDVFDRRLDIVIKVATMRLQWPVVDGIHQAIAYAYAEVHVEERTRRFAGRVYRGPNNSAFLVCL